jgi:hypothetical protein
MEGYRSNVSSIRGNTVLRLSTTNAVWCFHIYSKLLVQLYGIKSLGTLTMVYFYISGIYKML